MPGNFFRSSHEVLLQIKKELHLIFQYTKKCISIIYTKKLDI